MPTEEHNSSDRSSQGFLQQGVLTLALMQPLKLLASVGVALLMWGLVLAYTAIPAHAAAPTICVDGGACHPSLQAAIDAANAGDTIEIGAGEDTEAGIVISKNLTIRGQSATQSFVQAAASPSTATNRVFVINAGVTATLEDLTVRYGYINGNGGGISNNGTLTLQRVTVSQNGTRDASTCGPSGGSCFAADGGEGGGISNNGILSVEQSTISDNTTGKGGDIPLSSACSTFCFGGFGGDGGGISNNGTLSVEQSTISDNTTGKGGDVTVSSACDQSCQARDGGEGGGISNDGILSVERSTISDNTTGKGGDIPVGSVCGDGAGCSAGFGGSGGGISDFGGPLTMSNSTLSGNQTGLDGTCNVTDGCFSENNAGFGGGLMVDLQVAHLNNVTITNNRGNDAGGIYHFSGGASVHILTLNNSIVAGNLNTDGQPADCSSVGIGGVRSEGYNLVGTGTGCPSGGTGDLTTSDPKLGVLRDNGGPTKTHELLTDSPAIDAGPPTSGDTICPPPSTDQRGVNRPQDGNGDSISRCDIGAFEVDQPPSVKIDQASGQAESTSTSPISFTVVFNEPVSGFTDFDVTLSGTAGATTAVVTEQAPNDGTTYDVAVSGMTTSGTVIASIPANKAQDADGNGNTASTSDDNTVTFIANIPPDANEDSATTNEDNSVTINVLANDADPDGDNLTVGSVTQPTNGSAALNADNTVTYTPNSDFNGKDTFTYTISDANGETTTGKVTVTVNSVNDAPVANADSATTDEDTATAIAVLANDTDVEGESLSVSSFTQPAHGTVTKNADGTLKYAPEGNYNGSDSFTYKANDGTADSGVATVSISVTAVNDAPTIDVVGGSQSTCLSNTRARTTLKLTDVDSSTTNLTLSATSSSNTSLLPKNNVTFAASTDTTRTATITTLSGRTGSSRVTITVREDGQSVGSVPVTVKVGGNGRDTLSGTNEADILLGQNGDDTLRGFAKSDVLCGANGNDRLTGDDGADHFGGGSGTDTATDFTAGVDTRSSIP
jgi:Bacterial Ig domain/RTX calcium-binding nonapeptide repeat (4 copies)